MTAEVKIETLAQPERGAFKIGPFGSSLKKNELVNKGIPVAGIENVLPNKFLPAFRKFITKEKFSELSDYEIQPDDVLVTTMGTIGRAAVVPNGIGTAIIDSHLFRMRLDRGKVYPPYLCYAINGFSGLQRQLAQMARGAIMDGLNTTILKECSIPLPVKDEQKRIAAILDKADRLRRTRRYAQQLSDTFLQSVFVEMFGDPVINNKGWNILELESQLGHIDSGWSPVCGDTRSNSEQWAILRLSAVTSGTYLPHENKQLLSNVTPRSEVEVKRGDVLFTRKNTYELVAACAFVHHTPARLMLPDTIFRFSLKPDSKLEAEYLWALFSEPSFRKKVQALASGSAGSMPNISKEKLLELSIPIPPTNIQGKFARIAQRFERLRAQQREAARQAEHLFQKLLNRAFRGEL